jgi:hypothetical protein
MPPSPQPSHPQWRCRLTSLPDTVGGLSRLSTLIVSSNQLTALPATLGNCAGLTTLLANKNQLAEVPLQLARLPALARVNLANNPLSWLPLAVVRAWAAGLMPTVVDAAPALAERHGTTIATSVSGEDAGAPAAPLAKLEVVLDGCPILRLAVDAAVHVDGAPVEAGAKGGVRVASGAVLFEGPAPVGGVCIMDDLRRKAGK